MNRREVTLAKQTTIFLIFIGTLAYGLVLRPLVWKIPALPIEQVMVIAGTLISVYITIFTDKKWRDLQKSALKSVTDATMGLLILLAIGVVISAFIISGLVPMLVYYGIKLIHPSVLYLVALILPSLFSLFTGTSWGSAATIGVVLMGIGSATGANLAAIAGAVISGAYFGDKQSPLSDTTNMAAIAAKVGLYDHVGSMLWTTVPSMAIAGVVFTITGFIFPPAVQNINDPGIQQVLADLSTMFNFNIFLLIPLIIVLVGSYKKMPVLPVMLIGSFSGFVLALLFQNFTLNQIFEAANSGFSHKMVEGYTPQSLNVIGILDRGGFWELGSLLPISISILAVVGIISSVNAIDAVVNHIFKKAQSSTSIIIAALGSAIMLIATTANGIACSFVVADIFGDKFDEKRIDRRVLSRTAEDAGTLLEVLFPWTPAAIFFTRTLGVDILEFLPWAVMNWVTPLIAVVWAVTGIGCFKKSYRDYRKREKA